MSSTELKKVHEMIGKSDHLPEGYFIERKETQHKNFELGLANEKDIQKALEEEWAGTEFEKLPTELLKLVPLFKKVQQKNDVSPFVYEMF